jgi:hypothetical protein
MILWDILAQANFTAVAEPHIRIWNATFAPFFGLLLFVAISSLEYWYLTMPAFVLCGLVHLYLESLKWAPVKPSRRQVKRQPAKRG